LVFAHHDQQLAVAAALRADEVLHDATVRQTHRGEPATGHEIPVVAVTDVDAVWFVAAHDSRVVERLRAFASLDIEGHLVDTIERWPAPSGHDRSSRRLAFVTRLATIDRATFRERWSVHAALVRAHQPSIAAYTRSSTAGGLCHDPSTASPSSRTSRTPTARRHRATTRTRAATRSRPTSPAFSHRADHAACGYAAPDAAPAASMSERGTGRPRGNVQWIMRLLGRIGALPA
jgi:hypothetical protein